MKKYFELKVTEENGKVQMESMADGFNPFELLGILEFKREDVFKQMSGKIKPDTIKRKLVED